jgi:hypothetical protein
MMNDCWLSAGQPSVSITPSGYGMMWFDGKTRAIHRTTFYEYYGFYPEEVLHTCDVPCCYNPRHLRGGTHVENMEDMKKKGRGRGPVGERQHGAVLTEALVVEIRSILSDPNQRVTNVDLAKRYGVSTKTIYRIRKGIGWKHLV